MATRTRKLLTGCIAVAALCGLGWRVVDGQESPIRLADAIETTAEPLTLPTSTVMHAKMVCTQQVLAGLLSEDYASIRDSADELLALARDVPSRKTGDQVDDSMYEHFRYELVRLASELRSMGEDRNLTGAAYVHNNLTAACIGCHQHLRQERSGIELMSTPTRVSSPAAGPMLRPIPVTAEDR